MLIKEAEYRNCSECGRHLECISHATFGCDLCGKEFGEAIDADDVYELTVYRMGGDYEQHDLCSWRCVFKRLGEIKLNEGDFLDIPGIHDIQGFRMAMIEAVRELP